MAEAKDKNALVERLSSPRLPAKKTPTRTPAKEPTENAEVPTRPTARRTHPPESIPGQPNEPSTEVIPADERSKPVTEFYKVNGQEYTLDQLKEQGMLPKLVTTYDQHQHLQSKYLDNLKELDELKKAPAQAPARQASPEEIWKSVKQQYGPLVKQAIQRDIETGEMEADVVEMYPETINTLYTRLLFQEGKIEDLRQAVWELQQATSGVRRKEVKTEIEDKIGAQLDILAPSDEVYGLLNDADTREGFIEYLFDLNPSLDQVSGDVAQAFLAKQWFAYNADALKAGREPSRGRVPAQSNVSGEGPSSRPGTYSSGAPSHLDQLASAMLPVPE